MSDKRQFLVLQKLFGDIIDSVNLEQFLIEAVSLQIFGISQMKEHFSPDVLQKASESPLLPNVNFHAVMKILEIMENRELCLDEFIQILSSAVQKYGESAEHKSLLTKLKNERSQLTKKDDSEVFVSINE